MVGRHRPARRGQPHRSRSASADHRLGPQTIAWELAGDAAAGALTSFRWLDPVPPDGIFGAPAFAPDGKRMTMTDLNDGPATSGVWTYQLGLELHGQAYSTRSTLPIDTNTNPSIKNN